ncbi:unnamed protein product, partial [Trichobilharzia regenti]
SLFPGDVLLEVNGLRVHTLEQVFSQIQQTSSLLDCKLVVQAPKEGILRSGIHRTNSNSKSKVCFTVFTDCITAYFPFFLFLN